MPDAADDSCIHLVVTLEDNAAQQQVEWICCDCGRVFAWVTFETLVAGDIADALSLWAARAGVPERAVREYLRRRMTAAVPVNEAS